MSDQPAKTRKKKSVKKAGGEYGCGTFDVQKQHADKHRNPLFPEGRIAMIITGASGSGKSYSLRDIVPGFANLSQVVVCTKILDNPVFQSLKRWCAETMWSETLVEGDEVKKGEEGLTEDGDEEGDEDHEVDSIPGVHLPSIHIPETGTKSSAQALGLLIEPGAAALPAPSTVASATRGRGKIIERGGRKIEDHPIVYMEAHDPEEGAEMLERSFATKPKGTWALVIFDDFDQGNTLKKDPYVMVQTQVYGKMRNYGYHVISMSQSVYNIQHAARGNINMFIFYRTTEKTAKRGLRDVYGDITGRDRSEADDLLEEVNPCKYGHVLAVVSDGKARVFKNLPGRTRGMEEIGARDLITDADLKGDSILAGLVRKIKARQTGEEGGRATLESLYADLDAHIQHLSQLYANGIDSIRAMMMRIYEI